MEHHHYMQRCLELARLGEGRVAPNPMVGCVIVHDGRIIGEGYHRQYGEAHAEVNAVNAVADPSLLTGSVMYVSLEPCAHFGKTPPCADLIVQCGIPEVHIATVDPFAQVAGKGIARLRDAGITVHVGLLEQEARVLNRRFFLFHSVKRPFIILKWAETQDGFVDRVRADASVAPLRITGDVADLRSHLWRSQEAAIMVGTRTALLDDPSLTARIANGRNPVRVVIDRELKLPDTLRVFDEAADTVILNEREDREAGRNRWIRLRSVDDLNGVMSALYDLGIQSVLVEGGPTLHRNLVREGLWDEARRYVSTATIGKGIPAAQLPVPPVQVEHVGEETLYHYRNPPSA